MRMRISNETLRGQTVFADGLAIGTIAELFISSDWCVESIRIELRKHIADRIGANRTFFPRGTIELPVSFLQFIGDAVVLTVDVAQLREAYRSTAPDAIPRHVD